MIFLVKGEILVFHQYLYSNILYEMNAKLKKDYNLLVFLFGFII